MYKKGVIKSFFGLGTGGGVAEEKPSISNRLFVLVFALIYGGLLTSLPLEVFSDRDNYFNYARYSWYYFEYNWSISPLVALANEPLWLLINAGLATMFSPDIVIQILIFVPATLVAWQVLRQDSNMLFWLLIFLLLPQVINNHIVHLRQGVAIVVFLMGWFSTSIRPLRWAILVATPFIHASFFFILIILALTNTVKRLRLAADLRILLVVGLGIGLGLGLGWVVTILGARQVENYDFSMTDVSGLGFVFWGVILGLVCLEGRNFMHRYAFEQGIIVFYLTTYFLIEVTGRIFDSGLLLVLLAGIHLTGKRRAVFLTLLISYGLLQYAFRFNKPLLGFGF